MNENLSPLVRMALEQRVVRDTQVEALSHQEAMLANQLHAVEQCKRSIAKYDADIAALENAMSDGDRSELVAAKLSDDGSTNSFQTGLQRKIVCDLAMQGFVPHYGSHSHSIYNLTGGKK